MQDSQATETSRQLSELFRNLSQEQLNALAKDRPDVVKRAAATLRLMADEEIANEVASFDAGPLLWLTRHTKTENPQFQQQGKAFKEPFPKRGYFVPLFHEYLTAKFLFVPKSRTMMTSWSTVAYCVWRAAWKKWDCLMQTGSLDKAMELIEYSSILYRNTDEEIKAKHPLEGDPTATELRFKDGGRVMAIPSGSDKIRLFHPTCIFFDEAAFLAEFQQSYDTALPAVQQIIAVSSAGPGFFGEQCSL